VCGYQYSYEEMRAILAQAASQHQVAERVEEVGACELK
jgi:hypothetical protein